MKRTLSNIMQTSLCALLGASVSVLLQSCGAGTASVPKTPLIPGPINVQLNDTWNEEFPSQSVQLSDARYFRPPSAVQVVQGAPQCWNGSVFYPCMGPEKTLRARISIGQAVCEYRAPDADYTVLSLQDCGGISQDTETLLPAGTIITLENYDAPGQLLEVQFLLMK